MKIFDEHHPVYNNYGNEISGERITCLAFYSFEKKIHSPSKS